MTLTWRRIVSLVIAVGSAMLVSLQTVGPFSDYWTPIGPENLTGLYHGHEGRATCIAVNPLNKDDVWIGTAGGGVWHSTDGGDNWKPMSDDQESLAIGSIALAGCDTPEYCSAVYAGTGENAIRRDTYYGAGLLKGAFNGSTITWTRMGGSPYVFKHGTIYNVILDRTTSGSGQVIYITLSSGVTASASESTVTAPEPLPGGYGIYKSVNNGQTWTLIYVGGLPTDLEIDPTNHSVLYAGIMGVGIFRSTDAGVTWCPRNPGIPVPAGCSPPSPGLPSPTSPLATPFDHVEIAIDPKPSQETHLYATLGRCPDPLLNECQPDLYESTDGGNTWMNRHKGSQSPWSGNEAAACPFGYTRYTHALTVDPSAPRVWLGGVRLCKGEQNGSSWSWTEANGGTHYDHHAVVFAPSDPTRAYEVNDGGVAYLKNSAASLAWETRNGGLCVVGFQSIASSPFSEEVIGGTQDNRGMAWDSTSKWRELKCCGDGGFAVMEHNVTFKDYMYVTSNVGSVSQTVTLPMRSTDGGTTFPYPPQDNGYDQFIPDSAPRSFYPPFIEDLTSKLYFGTNALMMSSTRSDSYVSVSPPLSVLDEPEIVGGKDAITAIAVAPSNQFHVYLGLYSGRTFYSTSPCSGAGCWHETQSLPAPVTWLAVDPRDENVAYATVSGFFSGGHVYKTMNSGTVWSKLSTALGLSGVPANTLMVDQHNPDRLWLGTDKGVYSSGNAGSSWFRNSLRLPNVPVYAFTYTGDGTRLIAATHGRGAWILTKARGRVSIALKDQRVFHAPIRGEGFAPNQSCDLNVIREDGTVCASGTIDALGGAVTTDERGFLVSSKASFFAGMPIAWACAKGKCLDRSAMDCNLPGNPMSSVEVNCGGRITRDTVNLTPSAPSPPSAALELGGLEPAATAGGVFTLAPAVQSGDGSTRLLCAPMIFYAQGDTTADILQHARDVVNANVACRNSGVTAAFLAGDTGHAGEDEYPGPNRLVLNTSPTTGSLTGSRLVPAVRASPGATTGLCFRIGGIDNPSRDQILGMRIQFTTPPAGAIGGSVRVTERSMLGECAIDVPIPAGAQPVAVAQAVADAFQAPGIPGAFPTCPSRVNPRDLTRQGDSVLTAIASEIEVCADAADVGVALAPEEICFTAAHCDDGNPCTTDACNPAGVCSHTPVADGLACDDGNPCTTGGVCASGACGTPVVCNDGILCTEDACDPATGACVSRAIVCDDGNACTLDQCNAATGQCRFTSLMGSTCDDGDPCTSGETCVVPPGQVVPLCTGTVRCDDSDPCTADHCDPDSGACTNAPIECDDGNPCTTDLCQAGGCVSSAVIGVSCDDGNRCTTGDTCVFNPTNGQVFCRGTAINCDDGIACTMDNCDPVFATCGHMPVPVAPVTLLSFSNNTRLTWQAVAGALYYNSYRGTIPANGLGSRPPSALYDQTCFEAHDSAANGATVSNDPGIPPRGTAFYYLATEVATCGEGPIGADSNTTPIPNLVPCPPL